VLRQEIPPCREGVELTTHHGIAGVPIEGKMRRWYRRQGSSCLRGSGRVAFKLVFNDEQQTLPAAGCGCLFQLLVDRGAVRLYVIQTPEVKATNLICLKALRQRDVLCKDVILLFEGGVGTEVVLWTERGLRSVRPVNLEERACHIGDAKIVLRKDLLCVGELCIGKIVQAFAPHSTKLDPLEAEISGDDRTGMIEVRRYFVTDNGDPEWRFRCHGKERSCSTGCSSNPCTGKEITS